MKIDLLKYKNCLQNLDLYLKTNSNLSFSDKMTNFSVATHVPLIVVAYYIKKLEGESEDFEKTIKRLTVFYKYDEVVGIEELMEL